LISEHHLHPIVDHFTIALLTFAVAAEFLAFAAILISRRRIGRLARSSRSFRSSSLLLMISGATASVFSYLTGDAEADRLWNSMSVGGQQILTFPDGVESYRSHAVLGQYLMCAFLILAAWRLLIEFSTRLRRLRLAFLVVAAVALGALLYQGKTGGELVYEYGVGLAHAGSGLPQSMKVTGSPAVR
jgi:uncharacterized membrane protein